MPTVHSCRFPTQSLFHTTLASAHTGQNMPNLGKSWSRTSGAIYVSQPIKTSPDSKVHGTNMGPPGSCQPQMGPMLAPWTWLSGSVCVTWSPHDFCRSRWRQVVHNRPGVLCNIDYPSETLLKFKSRGNSFIHSICLSSPIVFEILHRAQQWYCRAICHIWRRLYYLKGCYRRKTFGEIWV